MSKPMYSPNAESTRKPRRLFLWTFLAVQALFLAWIIGGAVSAQTSATDCNGLDPHTCDAAVDAGTAIGVALIVAFWCVVDFLLGVGYAIYRLAKRP